MKKYFQVVNGESIEDMALLDPKLLMVFAALNNFCNENLIPLRVTSMVRPIDTISRSMTHQTGRAIDVKTKDLSEEQVQKMVYFLDNYDQEYDVGAISSSTGQSRLAYYHIGTGPHIHIQTRR